MPAQWHHPQCPFVAAAAASAAVVPAATAVVAAASVEQKCGAWHQEWRTSIDQCVVQRGLEDEA